MHATSGHPPAALLAEGLAVWRAHKSVDALGQLGLALHLDPTLPDGFHQLIEVLQEAFLIGQRLELAGRTGDFATLFAHALEARARAACSYLMRDYTPLSATESLLTALEHADLTCRAFVRDGGPAEAFMLLAIIAFERTRIDEAAAILTALLARTADPTLHRRIGLILLHYRQCAAAADVFTRLTTANARAEDARELGRALHWDGRGGTAELRYAVTLCPEWPAAWIDLGHALHTERRFDAAEAAFTRATDLDPGLAWAWVGRGAALQSLNRRHAAKAAFQRAADRAPSLIEARIGVGSLSMTDDLAVAADHFTAAVNLKRGLPLSPVPRAPGMYEALRGYCDTVSRRLAASDGPAIPPPAPASPYAEMEIRVGRLKPLATIPDDGRYHVRDAAGHIAARRLAGPETLPLTLPGGVREPGYERERFFGSSIVAWLERTYERFAWNAHTPFPQAIGCDGLFMARIDGCRMVDGYVFSTSGDYHEESAKFDELLVFARSQNGGPGVWEKDGRLFLRHTTPATRIGMPCRVLDGYHMFHYGAWLLNLLPKLLLLEADPETRGLPLVLPRSLAEGRRFIRETLQALGFGPERLLLTGYGTYEFDRAYSVVAGTHILSPQLALAARRALLDAFAAPEPVRGNRIFYVSRRDAHVRRVLNEDALMAFLAERGVEVIANADLDLGGIVRRFAEARCVIGVNGAGMANTLFCPPGTTVIELGSNVMVEPLYWMLSDLLGHHHHIQIDDSLNRQGDFTVSLHRLGALLDRVL